jgi:hypothetical protein
VGTFARRLVGAATLDASAYEGIERDRSAIGQALLVVLLSSAAAGVGAGGVPLRAETFLAVTAIALVTWFAWAMLVYQIGGRILPEPGTRVDFPQMLRTIGFAAAPGLFQVLGIIPMLATAVFALSWLWMFAAMVTAVQHALDYQSLARTLLVCGLAALLAVGTALVLGLVFGPTAS